jgi:hypothetical protein
MKNTFYPFKYILHPSVLAVISRYSYMPVATHHDSKITGTKIKIIGSDEDSYSAGFSLNVRVGVNVVSAK